jgi:hypothetical protein
VQATTTGSTSGLGGSPGIATGSSVLQLEPVHGLAISVGAGCSPQLLSMQSLGPTGGAGSSWLQLGPEHGLATAGAEYPHNESPAG